MENRVKNKDYWRSLIFSLLQSLYTSNFDVVFEVLDILFVCAAVDEVGEKARGRFYPHLGFLCTCGHDMDSDVLAQR